MVLSPRKKAGRFPFQWSRGLPRQRDHAPSWETRLALCGLPPSVPALDPESQSVVEHVTVTVRRVTAENGLIGSSLAAPHLGTASGHREVRVHPPLGTAGQGLSCRRCGLPRRPPGKRVDLPGLGPSSLLTVASPLYTEDEFYALKFRARLFLPPPKTRCLSPSP